MKAPVGSKGEIAPVTATRFFYHLIAGGVRFRLLESLISLNVLEVLHQQGPLLEEQFVETFKLSPIRAKKWLLLLKHDGFFIQNADKRFEMGPVSKALFGDGGNRWWYFKQMFYTVNVVMNEPIVGILQGKELDVKVNWPPKTQVGHRYMEEYNSRTAKACFTPLMNTVQFSQVKKMLDVGGGNATIACTLAKLNPNLKIQLYNLPEGAKLARNKIQEWGMRDQVTVIEGDFFKDKKFPKDNELILFSRVLCDWGIDKCTHLLTMAYKALNKGGQIVLCEPFRDNNDEYVLSWEFRYMFWDDFETMLYKSTALYERILTEIGFKNITVSEKNQEGVYRVMVAQK